jgi:Protein of unknown function (DUF3828)
MGPTMNADKHRWKTIGWALVLALAGSLQAGAADSPREFVQAFYNWYVPVTGQNNPVAAWDVALKDRSALFSPELLRLLKEDSAARAKAVGDIVGLDFDPFLSSQDPGQRYEVGGITQKGAAWLVEITDVRNGKKIEKPCVVVELSHQDGRWLFVNFHYEDGDLLTTLRLLREDREKSARP